MKKILTVILIALIISTVTTSCTIENSNIKYEVQVNYEDDTKEILSFESTKDPFIEVEDGKSCLVAFQDGWYRLQAVNIKSFKIINKTKVK